MDESQSALLAARGYRTRPAGTAPDGAGAHSATSPARGADARAIHRSVPTDRHGRNDGTNPSTSHSRANSRSHSSGESACTENTVAIARSLPHRTHLSQPKP